MEVNGKPIKFSGSESELLNELRKKLKTGQHLLMLDDVVMIGHITKKGKFVQDSLPRNFFYSLEMPNMRLPQLMFAGHQPLKKWRGFRNEDPEKVKEVRMEFGWKKTQAMNLKYAIEGRRKKRITYNGKEYDLYRLLKAHGGGLVLCHPGQKTPLVYYPETLGKDPDILFMT